ncbi:MAG: chemotaxis protein CheX [Leptospiraceae bacterium]|nr:chemotaxis protein CheX [Leptospiraceae bacterium]
MFFPMDPLLDEKIVITLARGFTEFVQENLQLHAVREAYGPSRNEGLCYEACSGIGFGGDVQGKLYLGMDGYTKLKMLPVIFERFGVNLSERGMADSVLLEFSNQIASSIIQELQDAGYNLTLEPPENLNHKLVPVDLSSHRQYILIFFLQDRRGRKYMGRWYIVLTLKKF